MIARARPADAARRSGRRSRASRLRSESGVALLEVLVAVAIMGGALMVFVGGLSTGLLSTGQSDRLSTAHELARSQMEFTKNDAFQPAPFAYATVTPPATYTVTSTASTITGGDANVETITVSVSKDGNAVFTLESLKVNR